MQISPWDIIRLLKNEISDLRFQNKLLRDKVAAFESGEKYVQMKQHMLELTRYYEREIRKLKDELTDAHQETIAVRELWNQANEDIQQEANLALEKLRKQVDEAQKKQYEAERKRDEALDKAKEKNAEMYAAKVALEEEKEKNSALTARIHKDHTNSSKPSSADPNHKTIHNSRKKSGRKPGGERTPHDPRQPERAQRLPGKSERRRRNGGCCVAVGRARRLQPDLQRPHHRQCSLQRSHRMRLHHHGQRTHPRDPVPRGEQRRRDAGP